ncbi:MAG TPA: DAK2 domain-containing protein [Candidatus Stercoripulliclostridium merdigallinarum]|uniref:DAK2 domain-containing protein n=1 Tax=Candidatus Stercoripulliclostridium merdigallinarum TaxID=2840951 RepID=A0A9D1MID0_9FIRM|nr:DAK2 domain-containing protein [Candidatus Stercoripulliclostridium merdigallinarum]
MFEGGALNLENNINLVNSLNVFPVPDGDTGTNMTMTMTSSVKEMAAVEENRMDLVCQALAKGALRGARGNSGVILSQIFKGMASVLGDSDEVTTKIFARALKAGSDSAYDAVTYPKEGTILTVIRLVAQYSVKISSKKSNFEEFFKLILTKGAEVLDATPDMLPVLKKAGVVDAGGKGLLLILEGMYNVLTGVKMEKTAETEAVSLPEMQSEGEFTDSHDPDEIHFQYCTEFFIINLFKKTTLSDIDKLRDKLNKIGDCVIVVGDLSLVKVHVHTNNPDKALGYALQLGELDKPKIENMVEQNKELKKKKKAPLKPTALVSICTGDGIAKIFKELRVDKILEGGQTMNPSVSNIVDLVDSVGAKTVYILPNNGNIVLAAEQAKELTKAKLVVIATKNIPQGIAAAMNFNHDANEEENTEMMRRAIQNVRSGQVTHSVRDTEMDGFELKNGDIIGIYDKIVAKGSDINEVTKALVEKMLTDDSASISLYYGEGVDKETADKLVEELTEEYPFHDVMAYEGGQQHYYYYVSVE